MSFKRAFSKIGSGVWKMFKGKAARKVAGAMARIYVPVWGPAIAEALETVDAAEILFDAPKQGEAKMAWARAQLEERLRDLGVDEKRIGGLIEIALLLTKGEAEIDWGKAEEDGKKR